MAARTRVILNDAQRKEVKSLWARGKGGMSKKALATKFGVSTGTIANILGPTPGVTHGKSKKTIPYVPLAAVRFHGGKWMIAAPALSETVFLTP